MTQFAVVDDCLVVGGMPLPRLAARVGQTPFYAYDRALLDARVRELARGAAARGPAALRDEGQSDAGAGRATWRGAGRRHRRRVRPASCASRSTPASTPPRSASPGPAKSTPSCAQAVAAGILVNVESMREVRAARATSRATLGAARARRRARESRTSSSRPRA